MNMSNGPLIVLQEIPSQWRLGIDLKEAFGLCSLITFVECHVSANR